MVFSKAYYQKGGILMLRSVQTLCDYTILAKNGDIGKIHDFLFDKEIWEIRYLVVEISNGLSDRKVLIPAIALDQPNQVSRKVPIHLTKEQVKNCPNIDTDVLMSWQIQNRLNEVYPLFQYWAMSGYVSASLPLSLVSNQPSQPKGDETIFRSIEDVSHCHVQSVDGNIGAIEDIVVDDESWSIQYIVANPTKWLLGRKFWIIPTWIKTIDWEEQEVFLKISLCTRQKMKTLKCNFEIALF
jgi:hypothetical protein